MRGRMFSIDTPPEPMRPGDAGYEEFPIIQQFKAGDPTYKIDGRTVDAATYYQEIGKEVAHAYEVLASILRKLFGNEYDGGVTLDDGGIGITLDVGWAEITREEFEFLRALVPSLKPTGA